jgi:ABC-2 type transport system permease protein
MNMYWYELKANLKLSLIWLIAILGIVFLISSMYPIFSKDIDAFFQIISNLPDAVKTAMGINADNLSSILGYYSSFALNIILLCGSLEAMILGISILSKEIRERTADFLFAKPVSRLNIMASKILSSLTLILISNILFFICSYVFLAIFSNTTVPLSSFTLLTLVLLFLQLIFFTLGIFVSVILPKVKAVLPISMGVVFGVYMLSAFSPENLRLLLPFKYFDLSYILLNSKYETKYLIATFLIIILLTLVTSIIYKKKDIHTV